MSEQEPTIDDIIKGLPVQEKIPVIALKNILEKRVQLDQLEQKQAMDIKRTYNSKMQPILARISQLLKGQTPKPEEYSGVDNYLKNGEKVANVRGKQIDNYWTYVLTNSHLQAFITEKDEKVLNSLNNIEVIEDQKSEDINFIFEFKPNQYFENTKVSRKMVYSEGRPFGTEGDKLNWKSGKWLTHETKKVNNKTTGQTRIVKGKKVDSFFDIFMDWNFNDNMAEMDKASQILGDLLAIVKDSLSYFLGLYQEDVMSDDEEMDEYEDQEESDKAKK